MGATLPFQSHRPTLSLFTPLHPPTLVTKCFFPRATSKYVASLILKDYASALIRIGTPPNTTCKFWDSRVKIYFFFNGRWLRDLKKVGKHERMKWHNLNQSQSVPFQQFWAYFRISKMITYLSVFKCSIRKYEYDGIFHICSHYE